MKRHVIYVNSTRNRFGCCRSPAIVQSMKLSMGTEFEWIHNYIFRCRYIICYGVNSAVRECPDDSHFNPRLGMCDQRESLEMENAWGRGYNTRSEEIVSPTIECRDDDNVEYLPSIDSCEEYFICANGTSTPHNCSDDLIYNIEVNRCTTTGRCLLDYVPTCVASGTYLPHLFECRHYFYCESDEPEPLLQACKLGQLFDKITLRCLPENEALCVDPPNADDDLQDWPH